MKQDIPWSWFPVIVADKIDVSIFSSYFPHAPSVFATVADGKRRLEIGFVIVFKASQTSQYFIWKKYRIDSLYEILM
jgi:hypothetical protein